MTEIRLAQHSANGVVGPNMLSIELFLYKNGIELPESNWHFGMNTGATNDVIGMVGSRIVVSNLLDMFA